MRLENPITVFVTSPLTWFHIHIA